MPRNPTSMIFGLLKTGSIEANDVDAIHVIARRLNLSVGEVRRVVEKQVKLERFSIEGSVTYCTRISLLQEFHIPVTSEGKRQSAFATDRRGFQIPAVITPDHPVYGKYVGEVTVIHRNQIENQSNQTSESPSKELTVVRRVARDQAIEKARLAFEVLRTLYDTSQVLNTKGAMELISAELAENDLPHGKALVQKILTELETTGHIRRKKQGFHGVSAVVHVADTFDEAAFSSKKGLAYFAAHYQQANDKEAALLEYLQWVIETNGNQFKVAEALLLVGVTPGQTRALMQRLRARGLRLERRSRQPSLVFIDEPPISPESKSPDSTGQEVDNQSVIDGLIRVIEELEEEVAKLTAENTRLKGRVIDPGSASYAKAAEVLRRHASD